MPLSRFEPVKPDIWCEDRWREDALTDAKRKAYDQVARSGLICPMGIVRERGRLVVRYLSAVPHEWGRWMSLNRPVRLGIGLDGLIPFCVHKSAPAGDLARLRELR